MASRGGAARRRRAQRSVVHVPPGPAHQAEAGRFADERDRPVLDLTWDYPVTGPLEEPSASAVLAEINGWDHDGRPLSGFTQLAGDGSTACGCWIYSGVYADGVNQAARRKPGPSRAGSRRSGAGPGRPTAGCCTTAPRPIPTAGRGATARRWSGGTRSRPVDRPRRAGLPGGQAAGIPSRAGSDRPGRHIRHRPVHHAGRRQGVAFHAGGPGRRAAADALRAAGVAAENPLYAQQRNPVRQILPSRENPLQPSGADPARTSSPTCYHLPADRASHGGRHVPARCRTSPSCSRSSSARCRRSSPPSAAWRTWAGRRSSRARRRSRPGCLCIERLRPLVVEGRPAPGRAAVSLGAERPGHRRCGQRAAALALDPNVHIQEVKAMACDIRPGRRRGPRPAGAGPRLRRPGPASPSDRSGSPPR